MEIRYTSGGPNQSARKKIDWPSADQTGFFSSRGSSVIRTGSRRSKSIRPDVGGALLLVVDAHRDAPAVRREPESPDRSGDRQPFQLLARPIEPGQAARTRARLVDDGPGLRRGESGHQRSVELIDVLRQRHGFPGHASLAGVEGLSQQDSLPDEEQVSRRVFDPRRNLRDGLRVRRVQRAQPQRKARAIHPEMHRREEKVPAVGKEVRPEDGDHAVRRVERLEPPRLAPAGVSRPTGRRPRRRAD